MEDLEQKITFDELVEGWHLDGAVDNRYDIIPRTVKYSVVKWYQIIETFEQAIGLDKNKWRLIQLKLPNLKRIFPSLLATDLVNVQPMTGPVGHVFHLNYKYNPK